MVRLSFSYSGNKMAYFADAVIYFPAKVVYHDAIEDNE